MSTPQPSAQGTSHSPAIPATDSAVSRSTRRTSIRHPPSTLRRVSPSSHTLTTRSSQQPDLWTTPPLKCHKAAPPALAVIAEGPPRVCCVPGRSGPSEAGPSQSQHVVSFPWQAADPPCRARLLIMNRSGSTRKIIPRPSPANAPPSRPERRTKGRRLGCSSGGRTRSGKLESR